MEYTTDFLIFMLGLKFDEDFSRISVTSFKEMIFRIETNNKIMFLMMIPNFYRPIYVFENSNLLNFRISTFEKITKSQIVLSKKNWYSWRWIYYIKSTKISKKSNNFPKSFISEYTISRICIVMIFQRNNIAHQFEFERIWRYSAAENIFEDHNQIFRRVLS